MKRVPLILLFLACIAPAPRTQGGQDLDAIKQILAKVAEEMDEIDRLLRESSSTRAAAAGMAENVSRIEELLDQTQESQTTVVTEIDKLLAELDKLTNQQQQQQQQSQSEQQQQGRNQPRRQNQTPDMVRQQRQQQRDQDQERNEQQDPPGGENLPPTRRPESGTETVEHNRAGAEWGNLPKYYLLLQRRGTEVLVPEKYLEFLKAYLNKQNKDR